MNIQRTATILIIPLMVLVLVACEGAALPAPEIWTYPTFTPPSLPFSNPAGAQVAAQATLAAGQSQMLDLSHQATVVSMNMEQAASAAAQTTLDYNQLQLLELSIQGTEISQNMARAAATQQFSAEQTQIVLNATAIVQSQAATQQFIVEQTQMAWSAAVTAQSQAATQQVIAQLTQIAGNVTATAQSHAATQQVIAEQAQIAWNATATAQSQAVTATYSAYILNVTQTAQSQMLLDIQATQAAQARATLTAGSLTATPWAALQAGIVRTREESERRAWWGEFVITPLTAILFTMAVLLLMVGGVLAYQRLIPVLELRLRTIWRSNDSPLLLVDGMFVDTTPSRPLLLNDDTPQIEIVGPSEPSVTNWITEAEEKLRSDGRLQP